MSKGKNTSPNKVAKYSIHPSKLKKKKEDEERKRKEIAKTWKNNKDWQEKKKPTLMKKLKDGSRKRRKLRKEGTICGCNKNFINYLEKVQNEFILYCGYCHKPKEMLK